MVKLPDRHPYSDQAALQRLLLMIATFVQAPGIGGSDGEEADVAQDSLLRVQAHMQKLAAQLKIELPHYSIHTLRKDLATLRHYGILERRYYRQGFYLGTGALKLDELKLALNALASQATYQGDGQARRVYAQLERRLRGMNLEMQGELFYPVRSHLNRSTTYTDPEEMAQQQQRRNTLFHCVLELETAIIQGIAVELYYKPSSDFIRVYPLQLMYHDVAWYVLCEDQQDGHLMTYRMDRLSQHYKPLTTEGRGIERQRQQLAAAQSLLRNGWGIFLGDRLQQRQERAGTLPFCLVRVRFFAKAVDLILEGERRHHSQQVFDPAKRLVHPTKAKPEALEYIDYQVSLPERSLDEFLRWVNRYLHLAQLLSPAHLVAKHRAAAEALVARYR
jgi:predicted DNA-binding transcriptional regulator YafY